LNIEEPNNEGDQGLSRAQTGFNRKRNFKSQQKEVIKAIKEETKDLYRDKSVSDEDFKRKIELKR